MLYKNYVVWIRCINMDRYQKIVSAEKLVSRNGFLENNTSYVKF